MKYAGTPPKVAVTLELDRDGAARASVADNGRGIPPEMRRRVFGRFVRLGSELTREKPGTGLGLYITRMTVRRLRGRIRIRNRPEGRGTLFEVWLPGAEASTEEAPEKSAPDQVELEA